MIHGKLHGKNVVGQISRLNSGKFIDRTGEEIAIEHSSVY